MNEITLNKEQFKLRCSKITEALDKPLLCILGKSSDVQEFNMNSALFHYLLGYEFPETIIIVQKDPIVIASPKKALILQQLEGVKIIIKNKDDSNIESILDTLTNTYCIVDKDNIKGDFATKIFTRAKTVDCTESIMKLFAVKENTEIDYMYKSGTVANYLLQKGIDLIRDDHFSKENLEEYMEDRLPGVNSNLIEFTEDPEFSQNHIKLSIRYRGYCTEIARRFLADSSEHFEIQKYVLSLITPGADSRNVLEKARKFIEQQGYNHSIELYTIGLNERELNFENDFELESNMCFCLNIDNEFINTFVLNEFPMFITKKDSKEDYSAARMRFRNKTTDVMLIAKIKEHQRELLDIMTEEQIKFYQTHGSCKVLENKEIKEIMVYEKDSLVPRTDKVSLDWDYNYVLVPILSYSVPFHISTIKNVSIVTIKDESRLRLNFKDSKEIREVKDTETPFDTKFKFLITKTPNVEELVNQINEMKKEFNKPKISVMTQPVLKEKFKKIALVDLYMRTDNKAANKKILGNLELHENGFKYNEMHILFSNIKNVFYQTGDAENRTVLHFNLKEPILHTKPTLNVQFFKKYNVTYHDTSRREDEAMELVHEQQEEEELNRINNDFYNFVGRIEHDTNLKVQVPERGFLGVHSKEAVVFYLTNECLVSLNEIPFFVLNFDEVEIVSFERVTFVTKTFDCVFIFKDKTRTPVTVGSIETTKLGWLKEMFDTHNILFMENKVNINWHALLETVMSDPLNFYQNGGWSELLRDEEESETESEDESTSAVSEEATSEEESEEETTATESESSASVSSEEDSMVEEDSSYSESTEYEDESTESSEKKPKKRKTSK